MVAEQGKNDSGQDTKPNGKCIIVLLILFPISMQLIKYIISSLSQLAMEVDGSQARDVDGKRLSGGS